VVANQGTEDKPGNTISIIDTATFLVVSTVKTGKGTHGVVIEPSGRYAYVTNMYGNDVSVIDLTARKVIAAIPTGEVPNGISFSSFANVPSSAAIVPLMIDSMKH
jgi:YVTN family beta-propeller protein